MQPPQNNVPLVSICIPVYNGEKTIRKTLASIINQKYKNIEIIIVDNCSSDSTVDIVKEFDDPRIRLIENNVYVTCVENFNRCFQYVNGEFMAFFHADDVYFPEIVSRQIETFQKYPMVGSVFTQGNIIDENDVIVGRFQLPPGIKGSTLYGYPDIMISSLEYLNFLPCPTAMLKTSLYLELSPFRSDPFGSASDFDMYLRAAKSAALIILDEKLINYRVSKIHGTYYLNHLRIHEDDYFKVLDYHISKSKSLFKISRNTLDKYERIRLNDLLFRGNNCLQIGDLNQFKEVIKTYFQIKYVRIMLKYPSIFKWFCQENFQLLKIYIKISKF
jgi:glycosyltransferase involved in cell wall biosynthesis